MTTNNAKTLIEDINKLVGALSKGGSIEISSEKLAEFGSNIALKLATSLAGRGGRVRPPKTLYMSEIGKPCRRQLWYDLHDDGSGKKEPLPANTLIKFMYGDILEELVLLLADLSGHEVSDRQKLLELDLPKGWKLRGRLDAKIDGEIIDVKSASTPAFQKFTKGLTPANDPFGYIKQLASYNVADGVTIGTPTSFIAIDKQNGSLVRDEHSVPAMLMPVKDLESLIEDMESSIAPKRGFDSEPTSYGNECLGTACSYCPWKKECWKDANSGKGVRVFAYNRRPVFLTKIRRVPDVPEITNGEW